MARDSGFHRKPETRHPGNLGFSEFSVSSREIAVKRSGMPNQCLGVLLHTMAISGLSRMRTELSPLLMVPSLAHPIRTWTARAASPW